MKSLYEDMGGTYTLGTDGMYYPDLELPENRIMENMVECVSVI